MIFLFRSANRFKLITNPVRLKRVFDIDVEICDQCGGAAKVAAPAHPCVRGINASMHLIACLEDPVVIKKILDHLDKKSALAEQERLPQSRAPP